MAIALDREYLQVEIKRDVRFSLRNFGQWRLELLQEALSFSHPEKEAMRKEKIGGWQKLPDKISLVRVERDEIIIPRGSLGTLAQGLSEVGYYDWILQDRSISVPVSTWEWEEPELRAYQGRVVRQLINHRQGIYKAATGSGKTVVVLAAIRQAAQRSCVIVNKLSIARQWQERIQEHLGIEAGLVGEGEMDWGHPITIALQQTLWSRRDELDRMLFFDSFGFVCADEVHHLESETLMDLFQRFSARWRIGVSATPDRRENVWPFVQAIVGGIIATTEDSTVIEGGYIVKPRVKVVDTDFDFDYIETHDWDKCPGGVCNHSGSAGRQVHRNNYQDLLSDLETDEQRNHLIAAEIESWGTEGRCQLVVSRRLKHLEALLTLMHEMEYPPDLLRRLTGKEGSDERAKIEAEATAGMVVFSTIADEALDIPRLDTIHLPFPAKNPKVVEQQVGRICRQHPEKEDALVIDYVDAKSHVLRRQYFSRLNGFYKVKGIEIEREREEE